MDLLTQNAFVIGAGVYGLYSAGKSAMNLKNAQGCPKCETTGVILGLVVAGWAGWELYQAMKK